MKSIIIAAALSLAASAAYAQTTPTAPADPAAPSTMPAPGAAETTPPVAGAGTPMSGVEGGSPIITLPPAAGGAAPAHFLADDLQDEDVYGANEEEIGEVEDIILSADGTVAAIVIEVGGFLGIGEKDVLVDWNAVEIVNDGDDLRLLAPTVTREMLEEAEGVDLDTLLVGRD